MRSMRVLFFCSVTENCTVWTLCRKLLSYLKKPPGSSHTLQCEHVSAYNGKCLFACIQNLNCGCLTGVSIVPVSRLHLIRLLHLPVLIWVSLEMFCFNKSRSRSGRFFNGRPFRSLKLITRTRIFWLCNLAITITTQCTSRNAYMYNRDAISTLISDRILGVVSVYVKGHFQKFHTRFLEFHPNPRRDFRWRIVFRQGLRLIPAVLVASYRDDFKLNTLPGDGRDCVAASDKAVLVCRSLRVLWKPHFYYVLGSRFCMIIDLFSDFMNYYTRRRIEWKLRCRA